MVLHHSALQHLLKFRQLTNGLQFRVVFVDDPNYSNGTNPVGSVLFRCTWPEQGGIEYTRIPQDRNPIDSSDYKAQLYSVTVSFQSRAASIGDVTSTAIEVNDPFAI
jgi:hypothetical protein